MLNECESNVCENEVTSLTQCCICDCLVCFDCITTQLLSICVQCDEGEEEDSKPKYGEGLREFESLREVDENGAPTYVETIRSWLYPSFLSPYYKYCEAGNEITFHCHFSFTNEPGITMYIPKYETISEIQRSEIIASILGDGWSTIGSESNKFYWFFMQHFDVDPMYFDPDDDLTGPAVTDAEKEAVQNMLNDVIVRVQSEDPWWSDIEHEVIMLDANRRPYPWVHACWKFTLKM